MTITAAIKKIEQAKEKARVTNDFHIYERRVCSKDLKDKKDLSQYRLTEYLDIDSLLHILNQTQLGIFEKNNDFYKLFNQMNKIIRIIEHRNTNIFWCVEN